MQKPLKSAAEDLWTTQDRLTQMRKLKQKKHLIVWSFTVVIKTEESRQSDVPEHTRLQTH